MRFVNYLDSIDWLDIYVIPFAYFRLLLYIRK